MSLDAESPSAHIKLHFESVMGKIDSAGIQLDTAHGEALLKFKEKTTTQP